MNESAIGTGSTSAPPDAGANLAVDSPSTQGSSGDAPSGQQADAGVSSPVQGTQEQSIDDILKSLPSVDELNEQAGRGEKYAAGLANLRGRIEPLNTQFSELQSKYQAVEPYQSVLEKFERPEQLQESLDIYDSLIGWTQGANGLEPATELGAQKLSEKFPLHADYLAADLLRGETIDLETGQKSTRLDVALRGMAGDPQERAKVAQMFGLVEPSSISPQWQPSQEELDYLVADPENGITPQEKAYQEEYKKVPFDKRQRLKLGDPEDIKEYLDDQKFKRETRERDTREQAEKTANVQRRENYIKQQADSAGDQFVQTQLTDALTTFHNSVVEQCNFISQLDPANLPQGMTPEQATQMNQQISQSNQAEAAQITLAVVGIVNPETRPFVLPLLKQIGVVDDNIVKAIDEASDKFGNNGRNYGHLEYRGKMSANGTGYQPDQSVTTLKNNASSGLKLLIHTANQIKKNLMEKRSQFFQMKAQDHNNILDSRAVARPIANGTTFNPATASAPRPQGWMSRDEINRIAGA